MTEAEFARATGPFLLKPAVVTGNMKAHGLRMKVQAMTDQLKAARTFPKASRVELRAQLRSDLDSLEAAVRSLRKKLT